MTIEERIEKMSVRPSSFYLGGCDYKNICGNLGLYDYNNKHTVAGTIYHMMVEEFLLNGVISEFTDPLYQEVLNKLEIADDKKYVEEMVIKYVPSIFSFGKSEFIEDNLFVGSEVFLDLEDEMLQGTVDLILYNQNLNTVYVMDHKTTTKSRSLMRYKFQLLAYGYLVSHNLKSLNLPTDAKIKLAIHTPDIKNGGFNLIMLDTFKEMEIREFQSIYKRKLSNIVSLQVYGLKGIKENYELYDYSDYNCSINGAECPAQAHCPALKDYKESKKYRESISVTLPRLRFKKDLTVKASEVLETIKNKELVSVGIIELIKLDEIKINDEAISQENIELIRDIYFEGVINSNPTITAIRENIYSFFIEEIKDRLRDAVRIDITKLGGNNSFEFGL